MDWSHIIYEIEDKAPLSSSLATVLGVRYQYLSDLRSGKTKTPNAEFVLDLIKKLKINPDWLSGTSESMFCADEIKGSELDDVMEKFINQKTTSQFSAVRERFDTIESRVAALEEKARRLPDEVREAAPSYGVSSSRIDEAGQTYEEPDAVIKIPLVERLAAGLPLEAFVDPERYISVSARLVSGPPEEYCAAKIEGSSMTLAGIPSDALALLRRTDVAKDGAIVVAQYKGKTTLKRLCQCDGERWELRYEDGTNRSIALDGDTWAVLAQFVAIL